jgi:hypothetical protein
LALLQDIDEQQNIINVYGVLEEEAKILNKLLDKFRIQ